MKYYICKLEFTTPYRFGSSLAGAGLGQTDMTCHADTLFSALANEAITSFGQDIFDKLKHACDKGDLLFSDAFPYSEKALLLPKPLLSVSHQPEKKISEIEARMEDTKRLKKKNYIPIGKFNEYVYSITTGGKTPLDDDKFLRKTLIEQVNCRGEESLPYFVEQSTFSDNCGLYFIVAMKNEKLYNPINELIECLSYSGIGGKRSSGYGKFEHSLVALNGRKAGSNMDLLYKMLITENSPRYMSLSTIVPQKEEVSLIKKGFYQLLPRSGFVTDAAYSDTPLKRNRYFAIAAGCCFSKPIIGSIIDVNNKGKHPVYRYGKGIYVGLTV